MLAKKILSPLLAFSSLFSEGIVQSISVAIEDDETGKVVREEKFYWLSHNSDDDNNNGIPDLDDIGFADDDIRQVSGISPGWSPSGQYILVYDPNIVRVWDSQDKQNVFLPCGITTELDGIPYSGEDSVWVEGIAWGTTDINAYADATCGSLITGNTVTIQVVGIDLDIDSDNDGILEGDDWEEHLEDHPHAIGKIVVIGDPNRVPAIIRLPPGLLGKGMKVNITYDGEPNAYGGAIRVFTESGTYLLPNGNLPLSGYGLPCLGYDNQTGLIHLRVDAPKYDYNLGAFGSFFTGPWGVRENGRPDVRIKAELIAPETTANASDEVKVLADIGNQFNPTLAGVTPRPRKPIRNMLASDFVYGPSDAPNFALKLLSPSEIRNVLAGKIPDAEIQFIIDVLHGGDPALPRTPVLNLFKAGLYQDYAAPHDGEYVLAFAGTEFTRLADMFTHILKVFKTPGNVTQYIYAQRLGNYLSRAIPGQFEVTGHSLGGGLASAAAIAGNVKGDTFNSSGLAFHTLCLNGNATPFTCIDGAIFPGADQRYWSERASPTLLNAYHVWFGPSTFGQNTPDVLTFVQTLNYRDDFNREILPKALGIGIPLEGLYNLDSVEYAIADLAKKVLEDFEGLGGSLASDFDHLLSHPQLLIMAKMITSHYRESLHFGMLHVDPTETSPGWNVYRVSHEEFGPK